MTVQSSDNEQTSIGQNVLLAFILVVLAYIVIDIFGFLPGMKKKGKKGKKRDLQRGGKWTAPNLLTIAGKNPGWTFFTVCAVVVTLISFL